MSRTQRRVLSITGLIGTFLLGFFLRGYQIEGALLVHAAEHSDATAVEVTTANIESAGTTASCLSTIVIRSGGSLYIEFPIEFQLHSQDKQKLVYKEADNTSFITGIEIVQDNKVVYKGGDEPGKYTIGVTYGHAKTRRGR